METQAQRQAIGKRYRFTADEYERLPQIGILSEDSRVELLDSDILEVGPIDPPHASCVDILGALLHSLVRKTAIVSVHNPVRLNEFSEPQPDVALLRFRDDYYSKKHPSSVDVLLLVEVVHASPGYQSYTRNTKLPYYALAGIPEVWIIDLNAEMIEQYTKPENAAYSEVKKLGRGVSITSTLLPSVVLKVDEILGH